MTDQARQRLKEMMKYCIIYPEGCEPTEPEDVPEVLLEFEEERA